MYKILSGTRFGEMATRGYYLCFGILAGTQSSLEVDVSNSACLVVRSSGSVREHPRGAGCIAARPLRMRTQAPDMTGELPQPQVFVMTRSGRWFAQLNLMP